jgi:polysaccharide deacetylase 2 family uncharacterized protein YibQ
LRNASAITPEIFSVKTFAAGLFLVGVIYAGVFGYAASKAPETLRLLEERLASVTVPIERPAIAPPAEPYNHPPAPAVQTQTTEPQPVDISENISTTIDKAPPAHNEPVVQKSTIITPHTGPLELAPLSGLYDDTPIGKMPRKNEAGLTPFDAYKRPFTPTEMPAIAIGIMDYGLSATDSEMAISALPPDVSLILSPYATAPEEWLKKARADGHEVWLQLPIENKNSVSEDMGAYALSTRNGFNPNKKNLDWIMTRATGYVGVAGFTDQVFLSVHAMLGQIMRTTFERGVGYFELNPEGNEFIETLAMGAHAQFGGASLMIDVADKKYLEAAQKQATDMGYGALVVKLTPRNVEVFSEWLKALDSQNIAIAPLSAVAKTILPPSSSSAPVASTPVPSPHTHHE